ncbi:MAG: tyrosine recombinase XerD [Actinobacteria bacterium]|nr:tyrosine recombinase XerD [Actinomycetota bacterium]
MAPAGEPVAPAVGDAGAALPLEVEEHLSWLRVERGRAPATLAAYRKDLRAYTSWLHDRGCRLGDAGEEDVIAWIAHLRALGRAPSTVKRSTVAVRGLHRFLSVESDGDVTDPSAAVAVPRVPRGVPKALGEDEVARLLDTVQGDDVMARRDRAILEVLYGTGMRISELVGLSLGDVDLVDGLARVLGKGGKERIVPVGRYASTAVARWLEPGGRPQLVPARWARRGDAEALLLNARGGRLSRQGAWGVVRRHALAAGLADRLTPHVLRHSCATHMLDHGADIRAVQELLGHASISTTQVYTLVSTERLWSAYRAAHPRALLGR